MENKTTKKCSGCFSYKELSLHGGDMPSTYICTNEQLCVLQSLYYNINSEDPMSIFMNHDVEKIVDEFKKYQEKWKNCPQKHCIFHGAYTSWKTFDERCKNCDQLDYYTHYVSE